MRHRRCVLLCSLATAQSLVPSAGPVGVGPYLYDVRAPLCRSVPPTVRRLRTLDPWWTRSGRQDATPLVSVLGPETRRPESGSCRTIPHTSLGESEVPGRYLTESLVPWRPPPQRGPHWGTLSLLGPDRTLSRHFGVLGPGRPVRTEGFSSPTHTTRPTWEPTQDSWTWGWGRRSPLGPGRVVLPYPRPDLLD